MTREQIERIAENCGVEVSYTEPGKGGFILDSSKVVYESVNDIFMAFFGMPESGRRIYSIDESVLFAA